MKLKRMVREVVAGDEDILGLFGTSARSLAYRPGKNGITSFQSWLDAAIREVVLRDKNWIRYSVLEAYALGRRHAWDSLGRVIDRVKKLERGDAIATLAYIELQGIAEATSQRVVRAVAEGMLAGRPKGMIMRHAFLAIDKVARARTISWVNTFVVRAHNESLLDTFELAGVRTVGIVPEMVRRRESQTKIPPRVISPVRDALDILLVEVSTAGDAKVCPECEDIAESGPYEIVAARMLLPAHPNCRCTFVPVGQGDNNFVWDAAFRDYDPLQPRDDQGQWSETGGGGGGALGKALAESYAYRESQKIRKEGGVNSEDKARDKYNELMKEYKYASPEDQKFMREHMQKELGFQSKTPSLSASKLGSGGRLDPNSDLPSSGPELDKTPSSPELSLKEREALSDYQNHTYEKLNKQLRDTKGVNNSERVTHLDRALQGNRLERDRQLYRGSGSDRHAKAFDKMKPGDVITDHGYGSTSSDKEVAHEAFVKGHGTRMKIYAKKGARVINVDKVGTFNGEDVGEKEFLLHRGYKLKYRGFKTKRSGKQYEFDLVSK